MRTAFILESCPDLRPGSWSEVISGILDPGSNQITVRWLDYDRQAQRLYFRAAP